MTRLDVYIFIVGIMTSVMFHKTHIYVYNDI